MSWREKKEYAYAYPLDKASHRKCGGIPRAGWEVKRLNGRAAGAEEIDDGADGWEGVALGWGKADIERGFELVAELDQVECVASEVIDKGGVETDL